jgi:hypothetical protein
MQSNQRKEGKKIGNLLGVSQCVGISLLLVITCVSCRWVVEDGALLRVQKN